MTTLDKISYLNSFGHDIVASFSLLEWYDLKKVASIICDLFGQFPEIEYTIKPQNQITQEILEQVQSI